MPENSAGPQASPRNESNAGKWDVWYQDLKAGDENVRLYGEALTYHMAASFFADIDEVEDWGCGAGGFRRFFQGRYVGVDGSKTPFADKVADLCDYRSSSEAILLRHVLEHDYNWSTILQNAVASFRKKLCLVLFTRFSDRTVEIAHNRHLGLDVPDLSFSRADIERHFSDLRFRLVQGLETKTQYGIEHVYFVWQTSPRLLRLLDKARVRKRR